MIAVSAVHIYPVKACRGISLTEAVVTPRGFQHDRQWMFVDERGMFVAQRDGRGLGTAIISVCLVGTAIADGTLTLTAPSMPALRIAIDQGGVDVPVTIWDDRLSAIDQGDEAEAWATEWLSRERPGRYRLVRMPDDRQRRSKIGEGEVAFNDAYPFLVISEASLADLNRRLAEPLPMNRFRPNVVLSGTAPYEEDGMDRFQIGGIAFHGTTRCLRCPTTATNQDTAERGKEPLRTLATYRRDPDGVVFGRNFNHAGTGRIAVGDAIRSGA